MKKNIRPKIEMFSPFEKPFNDLHAFAGMIDPKVYEYMLSDNTKIVCKCTPCQCCACR